MDFRKRQIFFDASGQRRYILSLIEKVLIAFISITFVVLLFTFSISPSLPTIELPTMWRSLSALASSPQISSVTSLAISQRNRKFNLRAAESTERMAFYVNWDKNSSVSLKAHADLLDTVLPAWLHLADTRGTIIHDDQAAEQETLDWIAKNAPHLRIMPMVDNFNPITQQWDVGAASQMVRSVDAQNQFIRQLSAYADQTTFNGIVLDLEGLGASDSWPLIQLIERLSAQLRPSGRKLYVTVSADLDASDLSAIARVADRIIIMAYDEHADEDQPGPIASQGWFEGVLDSDFEDIEGAKLIVGIGAYAYDWTDGKHGEEMTVPEVWNLLRRSQSQLSFDDSSLNPTFSYNDQQKNETHEVWYLDAVTLYNQVAAALAEKPGGLALWRLGSEDPSVWSVFARGHVPDSRARGILKQPDPGDLIVYQGEGDVLRVTAKKKNGRRDLQYDPASNLITQERFVEIPKATTITRWGRWAHQNKTVALTFDDGPSHYTSEILDILNKENVKATFFLIGANAAMMPDVVRRIYTEGHDIGNHTFTHPHVALLSGRELSLELTATQATIASTIGVRTNLFRPPFADDLEPETLDQATSLIRSADLGYTTIGISDDSLDWSRPGVDTIVSNVVDQVVSQVSNGLDNIVLLHDGGGDRSQTLAALPQIIHRLRDLGYTFATVHELMDLPRSSVMVPLPAGGAGYALAFTAIGLAVWRFMDSFIGFLFITGIALGVSRIIVIVLGATVQARRSKRHAVPNWLPQKFAVIIPAYNEARVICDSVRALVSIPCGNFEIIVVDDGSTDGTADALKAEFEANPQVRVLRKRNAGKASALSLGLNQTDAEIIVTQDADTLFEKDALRLLLRHFADPKVGAVAGAAIVGNPVNWLTKFQSIEYVTSQNLERRALELVNAITVVPGAIGAWRKSALLEAGGFVGDTLAEDADATLRLERAGWRVVSENRAMGRTEAPETIRAFCNQRFRWMFGMLQATFKHGSAYLHSGASGLKWAALPNIVLFQFLFTLASPLIDLLLLWTIFTGLWAYSMLPADGLFLGNVLPYWICFQILDTVTVALAFHLDERQGWWRAVPLLLAQRFCYRQLLYWIAARCLVSALHGDLVHWNKLKRTGRVSALQAYKAGSVGAYPIRFPSAVDAHADNSNFGNQGVARHRVKTQSGMANGCYDRASIFRQAHAARNRKEAWASAIATLFGVNSVDVEPFGHFLSLAWEQARRARESKWDVKKSLLRGRAA